MWQKWLSQKQFTETSSQSVAVTLSDVKKCYQQQPSFANFCPWMEYDAQSQCFLLEDGFSVAIGFELEDVSTEARSVAYLTELRDKFQRLFQDTIPQEKASPWILQFYLQDETSLKPYKNILKNYIKPAAQNSVLTEHYCQTFDAHCDYVTRPGGLFIDQEVTGLPFQGKVRRIRLILYRRLNKKIPIRRGRTVLQDANAVAKNVMNQLQGCGVKAKRMTGKHFYEWLVRWFNPASIYGDNDPDKLLERHPYPGDDQLPYGYDFAEQVFFSTPQSDEKQGIWFFDGQPHKFITIESLSVIPVVGHLSAEREQSKHWFALFDKFPEGSVFCLTVVIEDQNSVRSHIKDIEKSAVGDEAEAQLARLDCQNAKYAIEQGNYLYPTVMGVYINAKNIQELHNREIDVEIVLNNNGFKPIRGDVDLTPLDAYIRYLPMCYDYRLDKKYMRRSRYIYGRQIANLLPLYGRYRGTQHPGLLRFNRGGEPFLFDPLNKQDKSFNSHCLYFGGTGSGKSSALVGDLIQLLAIYNVRLIIIEVGNSFGLLADYCAKYGKSINKVQLKRNQPIALNPFAEGLRLLDQLGELSEQALKQKITQEEELLENTLNTLRQSAEINELNGDDEARDLLGEMALAAQLMITGGEPKEEEKMSRQDRLLILNALTEAAKLAKAENATQMLAEHVVRAMRNLADEIDATKSTSSTTIAMRLREMANGMDYFCKDDLSSRFFNRPGEPWPDVDVTVIDLGIMAKSGYEAQLGLATMGILNRVASIAEAQQYSERATILVTDESHIPLKNPLIAAQYAMASKTARKWAWWLWFATQNMADFPDEARKILSMIEFWFIMATSRDEIEQIKRFFPVSDEQFHMLLSIRKEIGKFTEGVILSPKIVGIFRNIPPRLMFALAQTEKEEKSARFKIMQAFNLTEIEAAEKIAEQMMQKTWDH